MTRPFPANYVLYRQRVIVVATASDGSQQFMVCQRRRGRVPKGTAPGILGRVLGYAEDLDAAMAIARRDHNAKLRGWKRGAHPGHRGRPPKDGQRWMDADRPVPTTEAEWRAIGVRT